MKKHNILIILFLAIITLPSCENWLDVNDNPNATAETEPEYLFAYATTSWSGNRTGGDSYWPIGFMSQLIATGGNFGWGYAEDRYDISPYSTGNTWKMYYATSGGNFKKAIEIAEAKEKPNVAAQCKIAFACMFYECTMIWGDIPYHEAWTEESYPKFDSQKEILENLIDLLDEAIEQFTSNSGDVIATEDLYYKGDIDKWKRLANSMKLKIAMAMIGADESKKDLITSLANSDLVLTSSDNFKFPFSNDSGNENPMFKIFKLHAGGQNTWMMANSIMLDSIMKPLDDPRIEKYFEPGEEANGEYIGVYTATEADKKTAVMRIGPGTAIAADSPDLILSSSEMNFYLAEIYLRGIGTSPDLSKANEYFHTGLREALKYYNVDNDDIDAFIAKPELDLTSIDNPLTTLQEQQWIDLYNRALESWVQQRRSGEEGNEIPNLKTPNGAPVPEGEIARRWPYPNDELTGNINAPKDLPHMWTNLWFDK